MTREVTGQPGKGFSEGHPSPTCEGESQAGQWPLEDLPPRVTAGQQGRKLTGPLISASSFDLNRIR